MNAPGVAYYDASAKKLTTRKREGLNLALELKAFHVPKLRKLTVLLL